MQGIVAELRKSAAVISAMADDALLPINIGIIAEKCATALRYDRKIMFAGNGGSAADAQHLAAELVGRFAFNRPALAAVALTTDTSALTAIGNDYGFETVFARQLEALGRKGDVFIALSTSGNSPNVRTALATCRTKGIFTVGLTGETGGEMMVLCDLALAIPSRETAKIQEAHIVVGHIICGLIEQRLFATNVRSDGATSGNVGTAERAGPATDA